METETIAAAGAAAADLDFSLTALFLRATLVVQLVMIALVIASFWSWAIIVDKYIFFGKARRAASLFEQAFWSGQPLDQLAERLGAEPRSALERIFAAGMTEWRKSHSSAGGIAPGAQQRIDRALSVAVSREEEKAASQLGFLASCGSISPFVGLFGTVWGIKHAFEQIAIQQNTNLATVAPGIAEALLATALGLLAAIPAVIFYNKFTGDVERMGGQMENFAEEFGVILSRQLERKAA